MSQPRRESYRIYHHSEETACDECGCPLYVGDRVHTSNDDAFCSGVCRESWERREQQKKAA